MFNLLKGISAAAVRTEPYPHLLVENVLPRDVCDRLVRELPPVETVLKGAAKQENARGDYSLADVRQHGGVSDAWRSLMEENVSQEFADDVLRLFGPYIRKMYPQYAQAGGVRGMRAGVRHIDSHSGFDILLDAGIGVNTPFKTNRPSSVRTAHVDHPTKLFAGLYYLRTPSDDSEGGAFVVCRWKKDAQKQFAGQHIAPKDVDDVTVIPYRNNTLVLFLNSIDAVHSVTQRKPTPHPRWFLNVLGEVKDPLFDIDSRQESKVRKLARRVLGAMHISLGGVEVRK